MEWSLVAAGGEWYQNGNVYWHGVHFVRKRVICFMSKHSYYSSTVVVAEPVPRMCCVYCILWMWIVRRSVAATYPSMVVCQLTTHKTTWNACSTVDIETEMFHLEATFVLCTITFASTGFLVRSSSACCRFLSHSTVTFLLLRPLRLCLLLLPHVPILPFSLSAWNCGIFIFHSFSTAQNRIGIRFES